MGLYEIRFTKEAAKDVKKLPLNLQKKLKYILLNEIAVNPYGEKRLVGDLAGFFSVRLSYKDRIVYSVEDKARIVFIHRTRTHYGD